MSGTMAGPTSAVSAEKVAESSIRVLSPRVYAALTGVDGVGIMLRMEQEVRERARQEWLLTETQDDMQNWLTAERRMVRTLKVPVPGCEGCGRGDSAHPEEVGQELKGDHAVEAELQWLRQRVVALTAELKTARASPGAKPEASGQAASHCLPVEELPVAPSHANEMCPREDPGLAKFRESMTRINCLQQELAATDKMLVERNDDFRKLEMKYDAARQELKDQAEVLAQHEAEAVAAEAGRVEAEQRYAEAEHRCTQQDSRIEELAQKVSEQDALIQALQHQLLDKDSKIQEAQQRAARRKGWKSNSKDVDAIRPKWNSPYTVKAAA